MTTLSLSEPGTGTHFYLPQTTLEAISPEQFRVSGKKTFVTNGGYADLYVVSTVAAEPHAPPGQFSCIVVPGDAEGLEIGPHWQGLGLRGNSSRTITLNDVVINRRDLLGREGDQIWYVFQVIVPYFLMAMAGTYLGVAGGALEEAQTHLCQRHYSSSGSTLAQQPVVQHRLGELWGTFERTRQLIYHAAQSFDAGQPSSLTSVFSAKAEAADAVVHIVNEVMTLMGGTAYGEGSKLHRMLRDARAAHVMSPTTDLLRIWAGRALLDQPLLSP
ncbi:acyl-CoA dehydrogenase family protein [Thiohalorhabdus sp. Cl-TMA]|uniref:Acyl-CoA dehydrogenase family protein n=1 Tax=Thiohalorhabdus methylotrophus TaxID=3242694 RepID=A0ABV4TV88_9GAMM